MPRAVSPQRGRELSREYSALPGREAAKSRLKVIGKEFPDRETDDQFQTNWKISKAREVSSLSVYVSICIQAARSRASSHRARRYLVA